MKKQQQGINNFSNEFAINIKGEFIRFKKGMSKDDVKLILGEPFKVELNANNLNEKLIFKINSGKPMAVRYSVLFTDDRLVYVAKIN